MKNDLIEELNKRKEAFNKASLPGQPAAYIHGKQSVYSEILALLEGKHLLILEPGEIVAKLNEKDAKIFIQPIINPEHCRFNESPAKATVGR